MRSTDDGTELAMMRWGMPMSTSGTFETCRPAVTVSAFGENRKSSTESQTDAIDPNRTSLHRKTRAASGCPVTKSTDIGSQG